MKKALETRLRSHLGGTKFSLSVNIKYQIKPVSRDYSVDMRKPVSRDYYVDMRKQS